MTDAHECVNQAMQANLFLVLLKVVGEHMIEKYKIMREFPKILLKFFNVLNLRIQPPQKPNIQLKPSNNVITISYSTTYTIYHWLRWF